MTPPERILIIDALNMYLRSFIINPTLTPSGDPAGGVIGFMKSLQKTIREMKPDQVYICWDGQRGSNSRKSVNKEYKEGRKPIRFNRRFAELNEEQELQNKIWQQQRLIEYLNEMPVAQLLFDEAEADDVISAIVADTPGVEKVIISMDKDFYQLLDKETIIYSPVQKKFVSEISLLEDENIHPANFALAKAVVGDKSDNVVGVQGVGMKTLTKRFPMLAEPRSHTISDLLLEAKAVEKPLKIHTNIIQSEARIRENYKVVQLHIPSISPTSRSTIRGVLGAYPYMLNRTEITKMMIQDGFTDLNWNPLFANLQRISLNNK